jgi:hypothetical protein
MMTREYGDIVFECDGCGDCLETGTDDWEEALSRFREEDWRAFKVGEEWEHHCPDCRRL